MSDDDKTNDPWEQVRHLTLDQLVTQTKLAGGSAFQLNGFTTPEKWPFTVVVAIAGPGNDYAVELANEFSTNMKNCARWVKEAENPEVSR